MMNKGELMRLTNNNDNVDSALPEPWLQKLEQLGLDRHETLYSYAYSFKQNSRGKAINLPLEFLRLLDNTKTNVNWARGKTTLEVSLLDIVISLLENQDTIEINAK